MNKLTSTCLAIAIVMSGCSNSDDEKSAAVNISGVIDGKSSVASQQVTRIAKSSPQAGVFRGMSVQESWLKSELLAPGEQVGEFTPQAFILTLDNITLYNRELDCRINLLPENTAGSNTGYIPRQVDLVYSANLIRPFAVSDEVSERCLKGNGDDAEIATSVWDGFVLSMLPFIQGTNDFLQFSYVTVDLGDDYRDVTLPNEEGYFREEGSRLHTFSLDAIQPLDVEFLSYLAWGEDLVAGVVNSDSEDGQWPLPDGRVTNGNSSQLHLAGARFSLDVNAGSQIVFQFDTQDLVKVYDNGTDDKTDDIVTLSTSNPFPFSLTVFDNDVDLPAMVSDYDARVADVQNPFISGLNSHYTLQWINPSSAYFEKVVVIRSKSYPADNTSGERVYEGFLPFFHDTKIKPGEDVYYRIFSVDIYGAESSGVVFNTAQSACSIYDVDIIEPEDKDCVPYSNLP